jgi:hypothetical protein
MNDNELLASLDHKLQLVRDRVLGVVEGYSNGFYLWGEGGTSKSFTVEETLRQAGKAYKLSNSRMSGQGLFDLLRSYPDMVHVLEDVETLFADKFSFGVLRSALWGQAGADGMQERNVIWQTARSREAFVFTGGIILVANCPLDDIPEIRALKTRIVTVRYQPTNDEVAALMRRIASKGHQHGPHFLPPEACLEVAEAIISRSQLLQRNLDLRLLVNTFLDRLQWANGAAETHWLDLLESRMKERVLTLGPKGRSRSERKGLELALVHRIAHLPPKERLQIWQKETGKSQAALYRRLEESRAVVTHFLGEKEDEARAG